ncbi:MAG: epoxyqueuosine reductase QueH [Lachnospiraceae bacterium]|nr:epoxyqueuosine reductase QueH [Lachnospiraceae bacterium]
MNQRNYQRELEQIIADCVSKSRVPRLLLHSCCAPCSSYVLEYLSRYFSITVFYYNPNIYPPREYGKRVQEQKRLVEALPVIHPLTLQEGTYEPDRFFDLARGYEQMPEGGERCLRCFRLRLEEAAKAARDGAYDYFTTTLTISPLKNAAKLNEIGEEAGALYGVKHLPSDFKKKNGYKRSIELSREYDLYRQNYCGCIYSQNADH